MRASSRVSSICQSPFAQDRGRTFGGPDTLTGGTGSDEFEFLHLWGGDAPPAANWATITDFSRAEGDKISFEEFDDVNYVASGAFTGAGMTEVQIVTSGGNTIVNIDVDGNGISDGAITVLGASLVSSDFIF